MLTIREKEVLKLVCKGYTNPQIADVLCISVHTAKAHVQSIIRKLNAGNRTLATYIAAKNNLIDFDV
jgi:DNA-binding NarL/FixJ family response regulator